MAEHTAVDIDKLHAESVITKVRLDHLQIDRSYQRDPSPSLVEKIANDWDEVSSELLLVSDRGDEGLWVVNGQHRSLAARKVGIEEVHARVINLAGIEDPAAVEATFRLRTNVRMSDKPLERFKAQHRAGNPETVAIVKIMESFNTEINESPVAETGINAVAAVERLYRVDDGATLRETMQLIQDTYGYAFGKAASSANLSAYAWFINKHAQESDRARLVQRMNETGLAALGQRARMIASTMAGALWLNTYRAIVDFYNERLHEKSRLEWKHAGNTAWKQGHGISGDWKS